MDALRKAERARKEMAEASPEAVAGQQESEAAVAPVGEKDYPDLSAPVTVPEPPAETDTRPPSYPSRTEKASGATEAPAVLSLAPLEASVVDQPLTLEPPRAPTSRVSSEQPEPAVKKVAAPPAARAEAAEPVAVPAHTSAATQETVRAPTRPASAVGAAEVSARAGAAAATARREPSVPGMPAAPAANVAQATAPAGDGPRQAHGAPTPEASRVKANAVFQSKRAVPPRRASGTRWMVLSAVLLLVLVAGAGGYLYLIDDGSTLVPPGQVAYQAPSAEEPGVSGSAEGVVERAVEAPVAGVAGAASEPPPVTSALRLTPESAVPGMNGAPLYAAPPEAMVSMAAPAPAPALAAAPEPEPPAAQPATLPVQPQAGVAPAHAPVRVIRSVVPGKLDAMLRAAWEAYMQGDVARAREGYQGVLAQDGMNRDGLLGMAAVEAAEGNPSVATRYYRRLLERDPRDAAALEGLAALGGETGVPDEQSLRSLSSTGSGKSGGAQFALGNLYAAQGRWSDAQEAYFDAYGRVPENPDYAFNLAISLEHLGQRQPALNYYRQALELARLRPHGFDPAQAQSRISALAAQGGGDHGR